MWTEFMHRVDPKKHRMPGQPGEEEDEELEVMQTQQVREAEKAWFVYRSGECWRMRGGRKRAPRRIMVSVVYTHLPFTALSTNVPHNPTQPHTQL